MNFTRIMLAGIILLGTASAQDRRACREAAARRMGISESRIEATNGGYLPNGNHTIHWTASDGREGFCVVNPRDGRVLRLETSRYSDQWYDNGRSDDRSWGRGNVWVPRVRVDTSGRGSYDDGGRSVRVTRGWVDTNGQPSVSLSGENDFKITFRGEITRQDGNRDFTMRITNSDRGSASGTARVRMNGDRNEVESITVNGRVSGRRCNGSFNRN